MSAAFRRSAPPSRGVAVVGIACRFPDARDHHEFFANLVRGHCSVREVTPDRWDVERFWSPDPAVPNTTVSKWCAMVDEPFGFDPAFFRISPAEARAMDPQQRLLLEESWRCIEDAGVPLRELAGGRTAVFVGIMARDYLQRAADPRAEVSGHSMGGGFDYMAANRISHVFDLQGPSQTVDAACASSLTAVHDGIQALERGDADYVLAGGAHLELHPWRVISCSKARMLSPTGLCRTFDADADGFVPGEGVGMLLLRRVQDAERDGQHVYGVLKGSAVNHGGHRLSVTAPTVESQRELVSLALDRAEIAPETMDYVEAHGTGTSLGDPIEVEALTAAFRRGTEERQYCLIGSVKTNVGHLNAAAGVAGLIKVLMMMKEGTVPASLHMRTPNPLIDFAGSPFRIALETAPWRRRDAARPLRAGVSSFGAGGGNSHVVVEEHRPAPRRPRADGGGPYPFLLSARTRADLEALVARWRTRAAGFDAAGLADACFTLATGRVHFAHRVGCMVRDAAGLRAFLDGCLDAPAVHTSAPAAWLLSVGRVELPSRADMRRLMSVPRAAEVFRGLEREADPIGRVRFLVMRAGRGGAAERSLFGYALVRLLGVLGVDAARMTAANGGTWTGLAATGMLDWRAAVAHAASPGCGPLPGTPEIAFLDPVTGRTLDAGGTPDAAYLERLVHGVDAGAEVPALFARAALLAGSQRTFRSNLEEWNERLRARGLEQWGLSPDDFPAGPDGDARKTLVRVVAIRNSLDRVHRKWQLTGAEIPGDPRLAELLALLVDGVLNGDDALALLLGEPGAAAAAASRARPHLADPDKPYTILRDPERRAGGAELDAAWLLRAAVAQQAPAARDGEAVLHLGAGDPPAGSGPRVVLDGAEGWADAVPRALLEVWRTGAEVRWDRWLAGRGLRRVPLPTYEFAGRTPFTLAAVEGGGGEYAAPGARAADAAQLLRLAPRWDAAPARAGAPAAGPVLVFARPEGAAAAVRALGSRVVLVRAGSEYAEDAAGFTLRPAHEGDAGRMLDALRARGGLPRRVVHAWSDGMDEMDSALEQGAYTLFVLTRALLHRRPAAPVRVLFVHPLQGGATRPELAAVEGMANSLRREGGPVSIRAVAVEGGDWTAVAAELEAEGGAAAARWDGGVRRVRAFAPAPAEGGAGVRAGGVFLITGGAGGLGLAVARHLLAIPGTRVALAGRSEPRAVAARLGAADEARLAYFRADVSQRGEAHELVRRVRERFGPLTGVVHAAGTLRDSFVFNKTLDDVRAVAAPKIGGAVHLDEATAGEPLEHFVLFSSMVAAAGNSGQTDYALANAFLDEFAGERERLRASGARAGRTVSIGWPLWAEGGMSAGGDGVLAGDGVVPMPTTVGLAAFDAALRGPSGHTLLLYGDPARLAGLLEAPADEAAPADAAAAPIEIARRYVAELFGELLEVPAAAVELEAGLDEYGLDSLLINHFNVRVERELGKVSKTILYECRTLGEVAAALASRRPAELAALAPASPQASGWTASAPPAASLGSTASAVSIASTVSISSAGSSIEATAPAQAIAPTGSAASTVSHAPAGTTASTASTASADVVPAPVAARSQESHDDVDGVAVIGMSGRFPMAEGLEEFWSNLAGGRDCVTGLPSERWRGARGASAEGPYCTRGAFLDDVDRFDPLFFNVSPREAELMDPQERLFLETAWHTFEDAGYPPVRLDAPGERNVGVFVGSTTQTYQLWGPDEWRKGNPVVPTSTPWTIANRVSFWMDLRGPSMPVDTACASSLTALHLACESIRRGECRMALAGAVNLYLHPSRYDWLCQLQMLSRTGACHPFGAGADGFVPGEGVGAVLLKPLADAIADGDRILGVIRGSAVNHGGRANGFMVPNPTAQAELVRAALARSGVSPESIGYLEAHGTGTALGDPIEVAGLAAAFAGAGGSIALGSVKSNIGHLEAAAGMAGLAKVLLQMEHRTLVPSLHAEPANPRIDFEGTPFRVQRELAPWVQAHGPRRAGISSFGAGGSNAHVVVEEYTGPAGRAGAAQGDQVLVLSARTEERLRAHCGRVAAWLRAHRGDVVLSEAAYQLQIRREPLEERVALVGGDVASLAASLEAIAAGGEPAARGWRGTTRTRGSRADAAEVASAVERRDLDALAAAWAGGAGVPWGRLHDGPLRSVRLPSYPFADERYWVPVADEPALSIVSIQAHPLLGRRDPNALRFTVRLTGEEVFLADHRVGDQLILPGVAYVEMARAAAEALGERVLRVRRTVFSSAIDAPREVSVELVPGPAGYAYQVFSEAAGERVLHGEGRVETAAAGAAEPVGGMLDVAAIRARCARTVAAAELYPRMAATGLRLGPAYQGVRTVAVGAGEVLSEIHLPAHIADSLSAFKLHPTLLDSALQASQLLLDDGEPVTHIPFSFGEVEILGPTPEHAFAHVVLTASHGAARKLDVTLADADGRVAVRVREMWIRAWRTPAPASAFFRPEWAAEPVGAAEPGAAGTLLVFARSSEEGSRIADAVARRAPGRRAVVVTPGAALRETAGGFEAAPPEFAALADRVVPQGGSVEVVYAWAGRFDAAEPGTQAETVFHLVRALLAPHRSARVRLLAVLEGDGREQPSFRALAGLLRTAARETSRLAHRVVELGAGAPAEAAAAELLAPWSGGDEVRHRDGVRSVRRWAAYRTEDDGATPLRTGGVYLVTGGAGALGAHVARFLAARCGARLLLAGRSAPGAAVAALLDEVKAAGGEARYLRCDVSLPGGADEAVAAARSAFGALNGVVHCAGVQRDALLFAGSAEDFRASLAPKVRGAVLLDGATRGEALDFVALFSSLAGVVGTVGQAGYACGNSFLDAFADWREEQRRAGTRSGRTISIDWPLWRDGGMHVDAATEEAIRASFGVAPFETPAAMAAFAALLERAPGGAVLCAPEDTPVLRRVLGMASAAAVPVAASAAAAAAPVQAGALADRLEPALAAVVGEIQKMDAARIERERPLADYGFDSIGFTRLANRVNEVLGSDLTPATFFEHSTLAGLAAHMLEEWSSEIAARLDASAPVALAAETVGAAPVAGTAPTVHASSAPLAPAAHAGYTAEPRGREPIAIIGMHGVLPQSEDLDEFWSHLENGRDLVTEIPADRWDWREFYGDPLTERDKTNSKWGGFLREVDKFDARFFGISPREAALMDPQQRVFLETAYRAVEEAGYRPSDLSRGRTGVYVGISAHDYYDSLVKSGIPVEAYTTTGMLHCIAANRVSYLMGLKGPSFPIDTACSSSLVALRSAVEAIWAGSCDTAIAGGVNLLIAPLVYISFARAGMMSPDGRCKTFDESANGYVRGEGAGALLLKPLSAALRDGDHVHAIIRGSAVNHGGRVNTLTTPNPNAQCDLIVDALAEGGVDPETVGYVEVHGTGTSLGDPIEVNGLKKAFAELRRRAGRPPLTGGECRIGSVKTNMGHLEAAAGVAGLFKVVLAMKHGRIPQSLHLKKQNPYVRLDDSPFRMVLGMEAWDRRLDADGRELPRRGGVSSFGFGGVNAHVLLEEHIAPAPAARQEGEQLFVLSAADDERLAARARDLAAYLGRHAGHADARELESELAALAAGLLGVPAAEVGLDEPLEELGLDSVQRGQLWERIAAAHGVEAGQGARGGSLRAAARSIAAALPAGTVPLADLAYTLQVGREPMERRLAVVASSAAALAARLEAFAADPATRDGVRVGPEAGRAAGGEAVAELLARRDLHALAARWVEGEAVEWERLHAGEQRRRLSLPTYPFARTRHWMPAAEDAAPASAAAVHPLLDGVQARGSLGDGVVFTRRLAAADRIVAEHRIHGAAVLPGVGHLEMARAAIAHVHDGALRLTDVVWRRPLVVSDEGVEVRVRLRGSDARITWTVEMEEEGAFTVCSEGGCELLDAEDEGNAEAPDAIRARCGTAVDAAEHYARFAATGIEYGPWFRGVRELWTGEGEALARIALETPDAAYVLHPTLMDAALQTAGAVRADSRTRLPFAVESVEMHRALPAQGFAHVRERADGRLDVRVLDDDGAACVTLRGLAVRAQRDPWERGLFVPAWRAEALAEHARPLAGGCLVVHPADDFGMGAALAALHTGGPVWRIVLGSRSRAAGAGAWEVDARDPGALAARLRDVGEVATVHFLGAMMGDAAGAGTAGAAAAQARGTLSLYRLVRALDAADRIQGVRELTVLVNDVHDVGGRRPGNPGGAGAAGLARTLAREYPHLAVRSLDVGLAPGAVLADAAELARAVLAEPAGGRFGEAALYGGTRWVRRLAPARMDRPAGSPFRRGGVYLLTGGASGIGAALALHLARVAGARLALVGRRPAGPGTEALLADVARLGGEAVYLRADVADRAAMGAAISSTKERFGALHGVVHGAMVLRDGLVARQDEEAFASVLTPKVEGTAVLAELLRAEPLDFLLLLSSVQSFSGSAGQGAYAAASNFQDAFGRALATEAPFPVKVVNWGFWGTVGSVASPEYRERMDARGVQSILPEDGMDAIERVVAGDARQVVAIRAAAAMLAGLGAEDAPAPAAVLVEEGSLPRFAATAESDAEHEAWDAYLGHALLRRLQDEGVLRRAGEVHRRDELLRRLGGSPLGTLLLEGLVQVLVRRGLVVDADGGVAASAAVGSDALARVLDALPRQEAELRQRYPALRARVDLLSPCLRHLTEVMAGRMAGTEVLFPAGSLELTAAVHRGDRVGAYCIELCAHAARAAALAHGRELRVLEVGAGTGGTTRGVAAALAGVGTPVRYDFTDVSTRFVREGERAFAGVLPGMRFRLLDIERPLEAQGFEAGTYDLVVAAGVLHATKDVDATLASVRALLAPGGWLVLNEPTRFNPFFTVTFGLLEGWWLSRDPERRLPNSPLMDTAMWRTRLEASGFDSVGVLGSAGDGRELEQRVVVARAAGTAGTAGNGDRGTGNGRSEQSRLAAVAAGLAPAALGADTRAGDAMQVPMQNRLADLIAELAAGSLGMRTDEVARDRALSSLGVDSIVGVELISRLNEQLGIVLKTIVIFDYPTVNVLAAHVAERHADAVARALQPMAVAVPVPFVLPALDVQVPAVVPASTLRAPAVPVQPAPAVSAAGVETRLADLIAELAAGSLGMRPDEVVRDRALSSLGVDSIVGVELISRLNERLGIVLKTIVIFDYPTVNVLAAHVAERHGEAVQRALPAARGEAAIPDAPSTFVTQPAPVLDEVSSLAAPTAPNVDALSSFVAHSAPAAPSTLTISDPRHSAGFRAVRFERPGTPRDLRIAAIEPRAPGAGEVEVAVRAFPINFSDFLQARGLYPMMPEYPFTPGVEAAGVVRRVGPGVTRVAVGDEVVALMRPEMGAQAGVVLTDQEFVARKPAGVSFEDACGFAVPFIAMAIAFDRAGVRPGERVLIPSATGANGMVAVQMALNAGAEVFATAGSPRKVRHLETMGVAHALDHRAGDFAAEVMRRGGGRGVDVVIDNMGGAVLQKALDLLAPGGRVVEMAVFGLQAGEGVSLARMVENQALYTVNAKKLFARHPGERARYMDRMAAALADGSVRPLTAAVFPFDRVADAYAAKEDRETIGRIVVSVAPVAEEAAAPAAPRSTDVAVVGMSGRFPGADDLGQLWENLAAGVSSVREVPEERWSNERYYDPDPTRRTRTCCRHGGFVDGVEMFDAAFFEISGKEAAQTDPQQRIFLEEAYRALEDAGYPGGAPGGERCGVFVGAGSSEYLTRMNRAGVVKEAQSFWGNDTSVLASRIAYFLDLKGPAVTLNTACSSSLVSLHLACQSIASGECDMALAGGAFLAMAPDYFVVATSGNMMSPEGRCKTFDADADGFGPGEGVGVLVLKPLARALADGDHVHGVIRGTAINQDGRTNGITAPSSLAQTEVELAAYERAGIDPSTIGMMEAHGTGTRLGDPIEVEALSRAFGRYTERRQFCAIGSIKTNIGHAATAAGVAGVIKVLLSLRHRRIPATLNFQRPNPFIDFAETPFFVASEALAWRSQGGAPLRAAVSSFGFSGTNAHVVMEEAPARAASRLRPRAEYLFPLSATTPGALQRRAEQLAAWLEGEGAGQSAADVSWNLQLCRTHFRHRAAFVASDLAGLVRALGGGDAPAGALADAAESYRGGETVDWAGLWGGERGVRIPLPTYPFERERHWYATAAEDTVYSAHGAAREHRHQMTLTGEEFYLAGHRVAGEKTLPGALYLELACRASEGAGVPVGSIRDLVWLHPLRVNGSPVEVDAVLRRDGKGHHFEVSSTHHGDAPVLHARGTVLGAVAGGAPERLDLEALARACPRLIGRDEHYERLRARGLVHGDGLASVEYVRAGERRALGRLRLAPEASRAPGAFALHPALVDGALQVLAALDGGGDGRTFLPFSVGEVVLRGELPADCYAYVEETGGSADLRTFHVRLLDDDGRERVALRDFSIKAVGPAPARIPHDDLLLILRRLEAGEIGHDAAALALETLS